jgi:hypothetical protein
MFFHFFFFFLFIYLSFFSTMSTLGDPSKRASPFSIPELGGINWLYATPMLSAPVIPLATRVAFPHNPRARGVAMAVCIVGFTVHGFLLITSSTTKKPQ